MSDTERKVNEAYDGVAAMFAPLGFGLPESGRWRMIRGEGDEQLTMEPQVNIYRILTGCAIYGNTAAIMKLLEAGSPKLEPKEVEKP